MMSLPLASPSPTPHLHHPHSRHHSRTSASPSHSPRTHSRFVSPSKNANASTSHRATPPLSQPAFAGIFSSSSSSRPMASQSQTPSWATRPPAASTSASTSKAAWTARRRRQTENSSADEADDVEQQQPPRRHRALDSPTVEEAGDVNPFAAAAAAASTSASAGNSPSHTRRVVARRPPLNRLNSGGKPASLGGLAAARALEDHFAQVSMTPPASFGSQTHNESPFGGTSAAAAATCYPATDLRNAAGPAARLPRTTSSFASAFDTQSPSNAFAGMRRTTRLEAARAGDVRKFGRLNDADEGSSSSSGDERRWGQGSPSVYAAKQGRLRRGLGQDTNASWPTRHTRSKTSDASDSSSSTAILAQRRAKGQAPPSFVLSRKEPSDTQLTLRTRMDLDDAEEEDDDEMGAPPSPSPPSASLSSGIDSVANLEPLLQPGPSLARRSSASASSGRRRALDDGEDLDAAPDSAPPAFSSFPRPNTSPTLAGAGAGGVPAKTRYALPPSSVGFPQPILSSVPMKTSKSTSSSSSSPYKAKRRVTISDRGARTRAISSIEDQLPSSSSPSPFFGGGEPRKRSGSARRFPEEAGYDDSGIGLGFFAPQQTENDSATPFRKGELLLSHRLGFDDTPEKGVFPMPAPPSSSKNKSAHRKSTSFDSLTSTPAKQVRRAGAGIAPPSNPFGPITKSSLANETRFSTTPGSGASSPSDVRETTSVPEGLSVGVETPAYLTPQNFKHIKPLQAAFMSTGLVSKRARGPPTASGEEVVPVPPRPNFGTAMDAGDVSLGGGGGGGDVSVSFAGDASGHAADESTVSAPTPSALPPGTMAAALGLRDVVAATARRASLGGPTSTMPDTPIKKPVGAGVPGSLAHHLMGGNASSARPGPAASRPPPSVLRPTAAPSKPSMLASVASPVRDELSAAGSVASSQDIESPLLGGACDSPTLNMIGVNGGMLGGGSNGKGGPASLIETSQFSTLPHQPEPRDEPAPQSLLPTRAPLRRVKTNAAPISTPAIAVPAPSPAASIKNGKPSGISSSSLLAPRPAAARSLSDNAHHHRRSRLAPQDPSTSDSDGGPPASGAQRIIPTMRPRFPRDPSRPAGGLQRKASFGVGSGSCGLGLGLGSFDNPSDIPAGSSSTVASSPATGLLDDGGLASPTLGGFWPIPSTPTRSGNHQGHSNIKWFQAARLVTTPSPPSRRQSRASLRYSRGGSKSKSSAGAVEAASSSSPAGSSDGPGPAREGSQGVGVGHFERHYVQLSVLGSGEFSEAVKASDVSTGIVYAVKRMKRPFTGPRDRLRHLEEVDILRHLGQPKAHPNVISLHEAWEQEAHLYIATDLCPLGTLALFLEGYGYLVGHLDEPRLWKVLVELSAGLAHIHESGVLHLDLKPANVFITAVGTLKIGDFGLASRWPPVQARDVLKGAGMGDAVDSSSPPALESSSHSHTRTNLEREGDREYLAPEIISSGHYSRSADVFSLGLIMVEAVGNVVMPDNGEAWQKLRRDDLSDVDFEGISVCMVRVIRRMLSSNAGERPEARELLEEHEVLGRVRERMARGLKVEELDQLPECGGGEREEDGESARQARLEDAMAVRGALIQEDEGFLAEVLMADPDPEAREMTPGKAVVEEEDQSHANVAAPGGLLLSTTWEEEGEEDDSGMLARHFADETWEEEEGEHEHDEHHQQQPFDDEGDESMDIDEA